MTKTKTTNKSITVRFTEAEKAALEEHAQNESRSVDKTARLLILQQLAHLSKCAQGGNQSHSTSFAG